MSEMKVLLLGWEFMPTVQEEQDNACYGMSKALGERVDLSMILPVADPDFILKNVALTGLNNVDLPAMEPERPKKEFQPFAEGTHIRTEIPLYGAPVHPESLEHASRAEQSEQAASAGVLHRNRENPSLKAQIENLNFFGQEGLSQATLDTQIIQFARWATRLAAHRGFDVIYAYDWRTFLAGTELKLVTGKPLLLQVHSLSQDRENPDSLGWMYQLEMQTMQKADCIITDNDHIASLLKEKYHIAPELISSLEKQHSGSGSDTSVSAKETLNGLSKEGFAVGNKDAGKINHTDITILPANEGNEEIRNKNVEKVRDILLHMVA